MKKILEAIEKWSHRRMLIIARTKHVRNDGTLKEMDT